MPGSTQILFLNIHIGKMLDLVVSCFSPWSPHLLHQYISCSHSSWCIQAGICWNTEEQGGQCVLGGDSAEIEPDLMNLSKNPRHRYYILYFESTLETITNMLCRLCGCLCSHLELVLEWRIEVTKIWWLFCSDLNRQQCWKDQALQMVHSGCQIPCLICYSPFD